MEVPSWVDIVKTGPYKDMAPYDADWYYVRAAAIARQVYVQGGKGVNGFRKKFGGRKPRGVCPERFQKASGGIIRSVFQQLEEMKIIEKSEKG